MPFSKVAYVKHCPGHKNSKGQLAEWCIYSHETGKILSSHHSKSQAKKHLQDMHAHEGSLKTAAVATALDDFTRAYIQAALWSSTDDNDTPLDSNYGIEDIAPSTLDAMVRDCKQFEQQNAALIRDCSRGSGEYSVEEQAGHDFWLTRCGHGAGFWDGDWPETGDQLTAASKKYGNADLYVGDDGYVYQSGTETSGTVPPRESYEDLTTDDKNFIESLKIQGSSKTAVYVEEQWEDILQKKGYAVDETTETAWEDTLYVNPQLEDVQVLLHNSGEPYYVVELKGEIIEQGTDPDKLWNALEKAPELYRQSIKHPRELNEADRKEMGILAMVKSHLLRKKEPKLAFNFDQHQPRQYDYEANGNSSVVLISPSSTTLLLEGEQADDFWIGLDHIEDQFIEASEDEYNRQVQGWIESFFNKQTKAASARYIIQVNASTHKKGSAFLSGVEYKGDVVEKLKFTKKLAKAAQFSHTQAMRIKRQLPDFRIGGELVEAKATG